LVILAALVLVLWTYPTANVIVWLVVVVLLGFAIIQFLVATAPASTDGDKDATNSPAEANDKVDVSAD
jgi:hypothetical protein